MNITPLLDRYQIKNVFDPPRLDPESVTLRPSEICTICDTVASTMGDPHLGLTLAQSTWKTALREGHEPGLLEFMVRHAATFRDRLYVISRYERLFNRVATFRVYPQRTGAAVHYGEKFDSPEGAGRHHHEWQIAVTLIRAADYLGRQPGVERIWFRNSAPKDVERLRAEFGIDQIQFDARSTGVFFDVETLNAAGRASDPGLTTVLENYATSLIKPIEANEPLPDRVAAFLQRSFQCGRPFITQAHAAKALRMSVRNLQRKLKGDGVEFATLFDDVRREIAKSQLSNGQMSVAEVAFFLGFSDATALGKAFHRWEGTGPSQWAKTKTVGRE